MVVQPDFETIPHAYHLPCSFAEIIDQSEARIHGLSFISFYEHYDSLSERDFLNNYCSINKNEEIRHE